MALLTASGSLRVGGLSSALWLLLLSVAIGPGCHLLIDGELGAVRCDDEGAYGPPGCAEGEACRAGVCAAAGAPLGGPCAADTDCDGSAFCLDPAAAGEPSQPFCSTSCCASTDCGPARHGLVCWSPSEGVGGLCWSAADLGRPAPGAGHGGDPCSGDGDCRSGVCADGRCADGCCDGSYCREGTICRVKSTPVSKGEGWACGAPPSTSASGNCNSNDDCATGRCVLLAADLPYCLEPCCSSSQCPRVAYDGQMYRLGCSPLGAGLRGCATLLPPSASGEVGSPCVDGEDCRSGLCIEGPDGSICSDLCCDDASCGDLSAFACRPGPLAGSWALRCVPR